MTRSTEAGYPGDVPPTLRPWTPADADALLTAVRTTPDLATQLPTAALTDIGSCRAHIAQHLAPASDDGRNLVITLDGVAVGNVGISAIDRRHGTGWVFYWVAARTRGQGLASAALATLADAAFSRDGLFRLELGHRVNNPASCAVATRAGFVAEGVERAKLSYGDERFDVETHARLRTDPAPSIDLLEASGAW